MGVNGTAPSSASKYEAPLSLHCPSHKVQWRPHFLLQNPEYSQGNDQLSISIKDRVAEEMPVPFGFSVGDFVTLGQLAFRVYRSYQDAPSSFSELSDDVKILHLHLKEVADRLEEDGRRILPSQRTAMQEVATSCQITLDRLDGIMSQYSVMDMQRQLTWERLRWQAEDQMQIKQDITVKLIAVSNLNQSLSGYATSLLSTLHLWLK